MFYLKSFLSLSINMSDSQNKCREKSRIVHLFIIKTLKIKDKKDDAQVYETL